MDLRRLHHLIALADERHFARAAERVHLSQPAFSRSIQSLEQALGQRLFDRATGDVRPTPAGQYLIERARGLLFDARCLGRDMALFGQAELGDIAFGAGPMPAATVLPEVLPELGRRYPRVGVRVVEAHTAVLLERLIAEDIEFFVADVRGLAPGVALEVRPVGRQHGGFFVRQGHVLAGRERCSLTEVWAQGVATTHLPAPVKAALDGLLGLPPGEPLHLALECDNVALLLALALSTDVVLGMSHAAVQREVRAGQLLPLQLPGLPPMYSDMGIVSLQHRSHSPIALRVIEAIAAAAERINAV